MLDRYKMNPVKKNGTRIKRMQASRILLNDFNFIKTKVHLKKDRLWIFMLFYLMVVLKLNFINKHMQNAFVLQLNLLGILNYLFLIQNP